MISLPNESQNMLVLGNIQFIQKFQRVDHTTLSHKMYKLMLTEALRPCNYLINRVLKISDMCFCTTLHVASILLAGGWKCITCCQSFAIKAQDSFADCFVSRISEIVCSATLSSVQPCSESWNSGF